jgi:hypothetical protein
MMTSVDAALARPVNDNVTREVVHEDEEKQEGGEEYASADALPERWLSGHG